MSEELQHLRVTVAVEVCGAAQTSCDDVKKVFTVLSADNSDDHLLLLCLRKTKAFLRAADKDGDGKIGVDALTLHLIHHFMADVRYFKSRSGLFS
uniref:EF-hand domain-containing protein n=1 Tax=Seriola dumerili TaxID=41447 RepID=A0A3B4V3J7_SERDU